MSKNKKTKRWREFIHFCIPSARNQICIPGPFPKCICNLTFYSLCWQCKVVH
jgi:hypothetical protein